MDIRTFQIKVKSKILYTLKLDQRLQHWSDERYVKLSYLLRMGKPVNLKNPRTYNEKLQWLKLNYHDRSKDFLVDKFDVKDWAIERIGEQHVFPTLALYEDVDEIDFDVLPKSFVLKATHDSGGVVIVPDKSTLDIEQARKKLKKSLGRNYYYSSREPQYKNLKPRIIAEPLINDERTGQLRDYKFFCFDGEVKSMFVASDRTEHQTKFDFFDAEYNHLDIWQHYPNSETPPAKPELFDEMVEMATILSQGHPHVRVDLYEANGQVYFGEMTFFHFGGTHSFKPAKWDKIWGDWLNLPEPIKDGLRI